MKRTNIIKKSINLALSILAAGSIVAVGADGTTLASIVGNNDAIITSVVDAAEVAQIPWSTAYVYGLLPIDLSTGGQGGASDGSSITMDYTAGTNKDWRVRFTTAVTADNQVLQFQYMEPRNPDLFTLCGRMTGGYYFTDASKLKELYAIKYKLATHQHLWEYSKEELILETKGVAEVNSGVAWYDTVDEGLYYRTTLSYNSISYEDGVTPTTGIESFIEVKATGEVYVFDYKEPMTTYNDILAKEIIYSCIPTKLQ